MQPCQQGSLRIPVRCLLVQPVQQVWRRGILTLQDHDEIIEPFILMTLETKLGNSQSENRHL